MSKLGDKNYRTFVGFPDEFDTISAMQFNLLTMAGLREDRTLLDIGCGSLRAGRLFMVYLKRGNYFGMEPANWLLREGIQSELGEPFVQLRNATFSNDGNFTLTAFGRKFDFLLAQSIFSHASIGQIRRCLAQAALVMKPTSVFFATFQIGLTDYTGEEWVYPGCVNYTRETVLQLAAEAGFAARFLDWPHPSQVWVVMAPSTAALPDFVLPDLVFREQAQRHHERLETFEGHPYVRAGMAVRRNVHRLRARVFRRARPS